MEYRKEHCDKLFTYSKEYMNENDYKYSDIILDLASTYHICNNDTIDEKYICSILNKYLSNRNISVLLHLIKGISNENLIAYKGWEHHMKALRISHNRLLEEEKSI